MYVIQDILFQFILRFNSTKTAMKWLKIAYNSSLRKLLRIPKYFSASEMFVILSIRSYDILCIALEVIVLVTQPTSWFGFHLQFHYSLVFGIGGLICWETSLLLLLLYNFIYVWPKIPKCDLLNVSIYSKTSERNMNCLVKNVVLVVAKTTRQIYKLI